MTLKKFATQIRPDQHQALERIATRRVKIQDIVMRALDNDPEIRAALVELKEEPEALSDLQKSV